MDYVEVKAKTVEDAVMEASIKFGVTRNHLDYKVLEKGSSGFLGFGSKPAVILARASEEEFTEEIIGREEKKPAKKPARSQAPKEKKKEKPEKVEKVEKVEKPQKTQKPEIKIEKPEKTVKKEVIVDAEVSEESEDMILTAKTFLSSVFKAMNIEAEVIIQDANDKNTLEIELKGKDMGVLIGKRGQTLDSLQYLTSLVVNRGKATYVRVKIDTENYRKRRKDTLENLARNIAFKVKRTKNSVSLEPMNPYERRIIHSALQNDKFVTTYSEGEEPYRKVVIVLKK